MPANQMPTISGTVMCNRPGRNEEKELAFVRKSSGDKKWRGPHRVSMRYIRVR